MKSWRLCLGVILLLTACAGLPNKPKPVDLSGAAPLDGLDAASGGEWPAAQWWRRYQDPTLDQLVDLALATSPTLGTAHARYDSAVQSVRVAGAASGARVDASADMSRTRLSDNGLFSPQLLGFTWYNQADLGLQASYTFDWWHKQRDSVEAAMDQAHASQADRSAAALMLASSVADTYFGWQADQSRLELAREQERTVWQVREVIAARVAGDLEPGDSLTSADLTVAAAREQIAGLEGSAKLRVVTLAALAGVSIAQLPPLQPKPLPMLASALPDDVRIDLISRRADVTASRWRVQAAEMDQLAARAEFFPDLTVNALAGVQSVDVSTLIEYGSRVPQISAAIHLPIFDAGRLKARYGASQAAINAAVSTYQQAVVDAARDVAMQAATRAQISTERTQRVIQVEAAQQMQASAAARGAQGVTDLRPQLSAHQTVLEQRDALLQLDAAALSADIALQRALGGGYESPQRLANSHSSSTATTP
jgi:outer membrane protein, multidrug efflux system